MSVDSFHEVMARFFVRQYYCDIYTKAKKMGGNLQTNYMNLAYKYVSAFNPDTEHPMYKKLIDIWHQTYKAMTNTELQYNAFIILAVSKLFTQFKGKIQMAKYHFILKKVISEILCDFNAEIKSKSNAILVYHTTENYTMLKDSFIEIIEDKLSTYMERAAASSGGYNPYRESQRRIIEELKIRNAKLYKLYCTHNKERLILAKCVRYVRENHPHVYNEYKNSNTVTDKYKPKEDPFIVEMPDEVENDEEEEYIPVEEEKIPVTKKEVSFSNTVSSADDALEEMRPKDRDIGGKLSDLFASIA